MNKILLACSLTIVLTACGSDSSSDVKPLPPVEGTPITEPCFVDCGDGGDKNPGEGETPITDPIIPPVEGTPITDPCFVDCGDGGDKNPGEGETPITEPLPPIPDTEIAGLLNNFDDKRSAIVTLISVGNDTQLKTTSIDSNGEFHFKGLNKNQDYIITVSQGGYHFQSIQDSLNRRDSSSSIIIQPGKKVEFDGEIIDGLEQGRYSYYWSEDVNVSGREHSSYINEPLPIEITGPDFSDVDSHASINLFNMFGISLLDTDVNWTPEHAYRLFESLLRTGLETLPGESGDNSDNKKFQSQWELTDEYIHNDIEIIKREGQQPLVRIYSESFTYASPVIATVDGKKGKFYSNRLFKAGVRFFTDNGNDIELAADILKNRYGIKIAVDANFEGLYQTIPVIEEDRSPSVWQMFQPSELIEIIATFEEFPPGMHDLSFPNEDDGLRYLLRRRNGLPHPLYAQAPAVAWTSAHYIEYMESAFTQFFASDIQRLVIHEKAHFMWDHVFSSELKYEWLKQSGWYIPGNGDGDCTSWQADRNKWVPQNVDPDTLEIKTEAHDHPPLNGEPIIDKDWASCSTTEFVTAYSAQLNPNEDMAESIAFFLNNPDLLRSRSLPKYEFIRDYIMQGSIYLSVIRPDLTFEVLNLYPDYVYPGKINEVSITVDGGPSDEKLVRVQLGLHTNEQCGDVEEEYCFEGAAQAYMRLYSPIGTYHDQYLVPVNGETLDSQLYAEFTLPSMAAAGWWTPKEIVVTDQVGNRRIEKFSSSDYGWRLYVNNPDADYTPPEYVANSMSLKLFNHESENLPFEIHDDEQILQVSWLIDEDRSMDGGNCFTRIANISADREWGLYSHDLYAYEIPEVDDPEASHLCEINWLVTRFTPPGDYSPAYVSMRDNALNHGRADFAFDHPTYENPVSLKLEGSTPDIQAPVLEAEACQSDDLEERCLRIVGEPLNPEKPNGETRVRIYYWAYEDQPISNASGLAISGIRLRNPQGQEFHYWHGDSSNGLEGHSPNSHTRYFSCHAHALEKIEHCNATTPIQYIFETILPVGSAPGTWGLTELNIKDFAGNQRKYVFTETLRFDVE
ncbi:carboxypeptidase-like regulatory domain-containing protein [Shewanella marisflavi]|uniref:Carboxypeptidase regulatory-like domain-containing protein n=1 Tax=Shewanella marisflavi TaxID=260364 RepID=A0AAC9XNU3_9GAMM|nr:carboxypeptidase-like regulatory domain-containing protein [Shewanella marisflavi]ASJ97255.1 hypothetical protein CFF01_12030 [Shewanella marisflavi]